MRVVLFGKGPCILKYILLVLFSSCYCLSCITRREVNLFVSLLQPGYFTLPERAHESRDAFKCYIIITYQSMRGSYVRKIVDAHEPPSHIWKADKPKYLELVSGPRWHTKFMVIWGRTLRSNSQATRLHFHFLYYFSEVIWVLFSISPNQIRHLCFKSLIIPTEVYRTSFCTVWGWKRLLHFQEAQMKLNANYKSSKLCFIKKPGRITRPVRVFLFLQESPRAW